MAIVRKAGPADADAIRRIHIAAFPTELEADLVEALGREGDKLVSLLACDHDKPVGHILLSRMNVSADGRQLRSAGLAPVAVIPERQGEGIGSQLIVAGLDEARAIGTEVVFVLGEPNYYRRFGFDAGLAAPFASPYAGEYFQARMLVSDLPLPMKGEAQYAPAFAAFE